MLAAGGQADSSGRGPPSDRASDSAYLETWTQAMSHSDTACALQACSKHLLPGFPA